MTSLLARRIKSDPQEHDSRYKCLIEQARIEAEKIIDRECPEASLGRCHAVWAEQKRILKEKHSIDWKSPKDMNKYVCFD